MAECEYIREPNKDCVFCQATKSSCRALNDLYCAKELNPCAFYKSKYEYNTDGSPKKESQYGG